MQQPLVAVLSFPGNNCEVESLRALRAAGMRALFFRWNDDIGKLRNVDGYFIPGGFSYEDRGRSGMVAGRDKLMELIKDEAARGKPVIGNCNGAQILVESGLIPLGGGLHMSLAKNIVGGKAAGFLSEWVWITPTCVKGRCATSDWSGVMHLPIAHGEGRFTTKDRSLWKELMERDQLVFSYCDENGNVAPTSDYNPNGSEFAAAGICNPEGNVVALMPHPERTPGGAPYFASLKRWIETHPVRSSSARVRKHQPEARKLTARKPTGLEIFIDTIIVNNEERTVEQTMRRILPSGKLQQLKYFSVPGCDTKKLLSTIAFFNPSKEIAYLRRGNEFFRWDADAKREIPESPVGTGAVSILRRDDPDTGALELGEGSETGICYVCSGVSERQLLRSDVLELFGNPHSSSLELL